MKILHINCNYAGRSLHQTMIDTLQALGVENNVFVPIHPKQEVVVAERENVCLSVCFPRWSRFLFAYKQKKIYDSLCKSIDVQQHDLIHAYTLFTDGNCAYKLHKHFHIPYLVTIRNTDINYFFKFRPDLIPLAVRILSHASGICFLSQEYKKQVFLKYIPRKLWRELLQKTHVIPNAIHDFWLNNLFTARDYNATYENFAKKRIKIIFVGGIDKNKNLLTTCAALNALAQKGWQIRYTVVGKIFDQEIADKVSRLSYSDILTPMPPERLLEVYRDHDIFVMPSFKETFGLVYAEAMSQGLPVVYTKGQGFDKQFKEGTVGYHVFPKDPTDIEQKILACVQRYKHISQTCLSQVSKFQWKKICLEYIQIYHAVLNN